MRNPDKEHLDVSYKNGDVVANYRKDKRSYPVRIARTSHWDRAIIRMMHANMRFKGLDSLTTLDLFAEEFKALLDRTDPDRATKFSVYMQHLNNKPVEKLGVNV